MGKNGLWNLLWPNLPRVSTSLIIDIRRKGGKDALDLPKECYKEQRSMVPHVVIVVVLGPIDQHCLELPLSTHYPDNFWVIPMNLKGWFWTLVNFWIIFSTLLHFCDKKVLIMNDFYLTVFYCEYLWYLKCRVHTVMWQLHGFDAVKKFIFVGE